MTWLDWGWTLYWAIAGLIFAVVLACAYFWWKFPASHSLIFAAIQAASWMLFWPGLVIVGVLAVLRAWKLSGDGKWHWPLWAWIWDNEEDGIAGPGVRPTVWRAFYWSALRNNVNNLRYFPGVSDPTRAPPYYVSWTWFGRQFYFKAGWESSGWPSISAGGGRGY